MSQVQTHWPANKNLLLLLHQNKKDCHLIDKPRNLLRSVLQPIYALYTTLFSRLKYHRSS